MANWRPIPQIRVTHGSHTLELALDDVDSYASFEIGREPVVLDDHSTNHWQSLADQAWEILVRIQPDLSDSLARAMFSIVPLVPSVEGEPYSVTSPESFGSAMMELPRDATSLAVSLIHEFQHVKLGALLDLISLTHEESGAFHYAPWRLDPRPISGLLQGAYAYFGIVSFWREYSPRAYADDVFRARFGYARWRRSTLAVLDDLLASDGLTDLGIWFTTNMRKTLHRWCEEVIPLQEEADAALISQDHQSMWRLRNSEPARPDVELLSEHWLRGPLSTRPGTKSSTIRRDVLPRERAVRSELVRIRWEDPRRYEWLRRQPEPLGAAPGDLALLDGDSRTALRKFQEQIRHRPDASSPWVGLGLAAKACGNLNSAAGLLNQPELVRAVYLQLVEHSRRVDPLAVAGWINSGHVGEDAEGVSPPQT